MMMWFLIFVVAVVATLVIWVRVAPHHPDARNTDPDTVTKSPRPNQYLLGLSTDADGPPVHFDLPVQALAEALHKVATSEGGVSLIAEDSERGLATYVQRTPKMGYPDYVTVKVAEAPDGGSHLCIYSRSRFGYRDMGVNKARVKRWLGKLGHAPTADRPDQPSLDP